MFDADSVGLATAMAPKSGGFVPEGSPGEGSSLASAEAQPARRKGNVRAARRRELVMIGPRTQKKRDIAEDEAHGVSSRDAGRSVFRRD
jgi:hypothetical protein